MRTTTASSIPSHPAKRVSFLLSVQDHARHGSLVIRLIQEARHAKLAGATAFLAHEGFGASGSIHRTHLISDDAPVTLVIIDLPDRIDAFLEEVADLLENVLVVIEDVDVIDHWEGLDTGRHR